MKMDIDQVSAKPTISIYGYVMYVRGLYVQQKRHYPHPCII